MSLSIDLLQRLAKGWDKRARVRSEIDLEIAFDAEKEDFLVELLPFGDHPLFINACPKMKSQILSCGWIAYNAKTITIETEMVFPVCMAILSDQFNKTFDRLTKQLITETLVDESYHIHLCTYGNEITKYHRNLNVKLQSFEFVHKIRHLQDSYADQWKKSIIQLVATIASEIFITDYLSLVSKSESHTIQPLNSLIVKTHRSDELVHGKIFTHIADTIFNHLNKKEKEFFAEMMPKPLVWLSEIEFDLWLFILKQIKFSDAEQMINESKELRTMKIHNEIHSNAGTADFISLAKSIGVLDLEIGKESFLKERILFN